MAEAEKILGELRDEMLDEIDAINQEFGFSPLPSDRSGGKLVAGEFKKSLGRA